jgi:hypothetical protein
MLKETLIGQILEHQTTRVDPALDLKWNPLPRTISLKEYRSR